MHSGVCACWAGYTLGFASFFSLFCYERFECVVSCSRMPFRTLTRRLVTIVGVAGGGSLLAVIAFSRQPPHNVRVWRWLMCIQSTMYY